MPWPWSRRTPQEPAEKRYTIDEIAHLFRSSTGTYADVDLSSAESALQDVAFASGVNLIASVASELPLDIYRGTDPQAVKVPIPGNLEDPAGDGYGREDWAYQYLVSLMLRGNAYGNPIDYAPAGYLTQLDLFHPDDVHAAPDGRGGFQWMVRGQVIPDLWHRRTRPMPGQLLGMSPVAMHATQIGLSIALTRFGKQWFEEGAVPATVLHNQERDLTGIQAQTVKDRFVAAVRGSREPVVLDRGWKLDQVQIAPEESQFLQTQQFSEAQTARILGPGVAELLGYETGGNLTYSTSQDRANDFQKFTLNYWLKILERAYREFLPRGLVPRVDRDALLEALPLDRFQAYNVASGGVPWLKPNEIRPKEGLPPLPEEETDAREITEMIQKVYLGVGKVITTDEAREMVNQAGANLVIPAPDEAKDQLKSGGGSNGPGAE